MKLTIRTTPQARNYQCDKCKSILCHKDMYDDTICYSCYNKKSPSTSQSEGTELSFKVPSQSSDKGSKPSSLN